MKLRERFYYFFHAEEIKQKLENSKSNSPAKITPKKEKISRVISQSGVERYKSFAGAMFSKGVTEQQLADKFEVTRQMINYIITGRRKSKKLEQGICRELGLNYNEMYKEAV